MNIRRITLRHFSLYSRVNNPIQKEMIYDQILDKPDDSVWTTEEYINKGFALLAVDKFKYKYVALEAFDDAKKLDIKGLYHAEIKSGQEQARGETDEYEQIAFSKI